MSAEAQTVEVKPEENKIPLSVSSFEGNAAPPKEAVITPEKLVDGTVEVKTDPVLPKTDPVIANAEDIWTKETGWKSVDEAKAAKAELESLKTKKSESFKWEGQEDGIYNMLHSRKQLDRVEKLDATKPKDAAEIIKTAMLLKDKDQDLTQDDVDFIFNDKYEIPEKPKKGEDQDEDEYATKVAKWEKQVEFINKKMTIDAKLAKPELSKLKSELVLPDISKADSQAAAPTQESLDAIKQIRDNFLRTVDTDFAKFNGFTTTVKDESVEFPVTFKVDDSDKAEIKKLAQEMNVDEYFGKRWFDEKGNAKVEQMMSDLYLLEKKEKAFQGVANQSAAERRKEIIKQNSNIKLNGVTSQTTIQKPADMSRKYQEEKAIMTG